MEFLTIFCKMSYYIKSSISQGNLYVLEQKCGQNCWKLSGHNRVVNMQFQNSFSIIYNGQLISNHFSNCYRKLRNRIQRSTDNNSELFNCCQRQRNIFRKQEIKIIIPRKKCTFTNQVQMFTVFDRNIICTVWYCFSGLNNPTRQFRK